MTLPALSYVHCCCYCLRSQRSLWSTGYGPTSMIIKTLYQANDYAPRLDSNKQHGAPWDDIGKTALSSPLPSSWWFGCLNDITRPSSQQDSTSLHSATSQWLCKRLLAYRRWKRCHRYLTHLYQSVYKKTCKEEQGNPTKVKRSLLRGRCCSQFYLDRGWHPARNLCISPASRTTQARASNIQHCLLPDCLPLQLRACRTPEVPGGTTHQQSSVQKHSICSHYPSSVKRSEPLPSVPTSFLSLFFLSTLVHLSTPLPFS